MDKIEKFFHEASIEWWNPTEGVDKRFWFFKKQLMFICSAITRIKKEAGYSVALDAGCGRGVHSNLLKIIGCNTIFSLDINNEMLEQTRSNYGTDCIQASLLKFPFEDSCIDVIVSIGTLMHVPYTELALREIFRVLSKGGIAIVSSSNVFSLYTFWTTRLNPALANHQRLYYRRQFSYWQFRKMLANTGFTILESRGFATVPPLSLLPNWRLSVIPVTISRRISTFLDPLLAKWFGCALTFVVTK